MYADLKAVLDATPQLSQRLDSTNDQLRDLSVFARRLGMYDADDFIKNALNRNR